MTPLAAPPEAIIRFLNAGQGDCVLMETSSHVIVIDSNIPAGHIESPLMPHLRRIAGDRKRMGIPLRAVVCLSHPDKDHFTGLFEAFQFLEQHGQVEAVVVSEMDRTLLVATLRADDRRNVLNFPPEILPKDEYIRFARHVRDNYQDRGNFFRGIGQRDVPLAADLTVYILGPDDGTAKSMTDRIVSKVVRDLFSKREPRNISPNELSVILWIVLPSAAIMLTGDTSGRVWLKALNLYTDARNRAPQTRPYPLAAQIVKAPHHGGDCVEEQEWRDILNHLAGGDSRAAGKDTHIVFSSGGHLGYGHPSSLTTSRVASHRCRPLLHCTNRCPGHQDLHGPGPYQGDITFTISADGIAVEPPSPTACPPCELHPLYAQAAT